MSVGQSERTPGVIFDDQPRDVAPVSVSVAGVGLVAMSIASTRDVVKSGSCGSKTADADGGGMPRSVLLQIAKMKTASPNTQTQNRQNLRESETEMLHLHLAL